MTQSLSSPDLRALSDKLAAAGVPFTYYSLGKHRDERTCLIEYEGQWLVYYAERGQRTDLRTFGRFTEASDHLLKTLSQ